MNKKKTFEMDELQGEAAALAEARTKRVSRLFKMIEICLKDKKPDPSVVEEAKELAKLWGTSAGSFDLAVSRFTTTDLLLLLGGLVVELRPAYYFYKWAAKHHPAELDNLRFMAFQDSLPSIPRTSSSRKDYELERRGPYRNDIERQFGGAPETDPMESILQLFGAPRRNDCLDAIFTGGRVKMRGLEDLFGMERHRFPKKLRRVKEGPTYRYDYRAVVAIMSALLNEKPRTSGASGPGRPPRAPWLNCFGLRTRVLNGIEARLSTLPATEKVRREFLSVVHSHTGDSGKQ